MLDNPNPEPRTDVQPEPVTTPQPVSEPTVPPTTETTPAVDPAQQPIDYETKFAESTRENQILAAQLEQERQENARRKLTNEPTDSDLRAAFPEWDILTDTEQKFARRQFQIERVAASLQEEREQEKAEKRWNTDLELTIAKIPALQGKDQAFKEFAKRPTHRGAPLETLVSAFLFESSSNPSSTPVPTPSAPGLLPGNGGPREAEKPKLLSGEDLKTLRQTDEKAYRNYIATHDISQLEL